MISPSTREALTGRWAISAAPYLLLAPAIIISVVLLEATSFKLTELMGWLIASASGYVFFCLFVYLAHKTLFRNRVTKPVPIWWIFALGLVGGGLKGVATAVMSVGLGLDSPLREAIMSRISVATFLGLCGVPAMALIMNSLANFRQQRRELIAERILVESRQMQSQEMSIAMGANLRLTIESELDLMLHDLRTSLESKTSLNSSWETISEDLRTAANETVRGMSHRLWEHNNQDISELTFIDLGKAMITTSAFPQRFIPPILFVSALPYTNKIFAFQESLLRVIVMVAFTSIVFHLSTLAITRWPAKKYLTYFIGIAIVSITPIPIGNLMFGSSVSSSWVGVAATLAIWIPLLTITAGLIDTALKQRKEILDELQTQVAQSQIRAISESNETTRLNKDMAKYLHGKLQTRLMASAFAIELAGRADDSTSLTAEIEKARRSVTTPFDEFWVESFSSLEVALQKLVDVWMGILSPTLSIVGIDNEGDPTRNRNMVHVIEEAFSNSLRHGLATRAHVIVVQVENGTSVTVIDDGIGPRTGTPGLGSALFNSVAGKSWSLTRGPGGIGTQLNLLILDI